MLNRLRIKFVCINMGVVLAMLAVMCLLILNSTARNLEEESMELLRSVLIDAERPELRGFDFRWGGGEALPEPFPEEKRGGGRFAGTLLYIRVTLGKDGSVLSRDSNFSGDLEDLPVEELVTLAAGDTGVLKDWNLRYLRSRSPQGTETLVFGDISAERSTLGDLTRNVLVTGGLSILGFLGLSVLLAFWAVRPVEEAWKRQKQFVSDASHELKTPLTVIMTNAELLQSPEYDAAARQRFGDNILTMARQMRGLVENLLELARVDNGAVAQQSAEVDLSALCEAAALPFEPLYFERGLTLRTDIEPGVTVRGSGSYLRQAVEILLDNAGKYADPDTEVTLRLVRNGRNCVLSVADHGAPISPEDMKHLFERFYRADKARSRDGSFGLGLSIARKIAEAHRGKIRAESAGGLNTFYIILPVSHASGPAVS